ncbi:unnamed protein product [Allacma fusca]|uniref:Uncharacterized protein n=1 Tax=Allacma fusca TaxID=39272 RepID=A0A8J2LBN3_9HEXA|nr:unnamed protein product [Allacma fusca]
MKCVGVFVLVVATLVAVSAVERNSFNVEEIAIDQPSQSSLENTKQHQRQVQGDCLGSGKIVHDVCTQCCSGCVAMDPPHFHGLFECL